MLRPRPNIDYTSKDYEAFRHDMINLIPHILPEYTDFSQSDAGIMMIELNAYVADILSYYQDRQANETYLGTATQRKSVIDITRQLGYPLKNAVPSSSRLVVVLSEPAGSQFTIPRGFSVSTEGSDYEEEITFETMEDLVIPRGALGNEKDPDTGEYLYTAEIVQGITIPSEIVGSSNGQPQQRFRLEYQNVIDGSVNIYVDEGGGLELWTDVTNDLIGSTEDGKQYHRETDEDGFTYIVFGDGLNGKIPAIGTDNIYGGYRVGGGEYTNVGSNAITVANTNIAGIEEIFNPIPATGGVDRETINSAKNQAPKSFRTQERAVTPEDYENIALTIPGVAKARAVPDELSATTVLVTIAPSGGGIPNSNLIEDVANLLDDRKMITTNVVIEMPKYVMTKITVEARIHDTWSRKEVQAYITESLKSLFNFDTRDFGEGVPVSRIYHDLMQVQGMYSLILKRTTIDPVIDWVIVSGNPTFENVTVNPNLEYRGEWKIEMTSSTNFKVVKVDRNTDGGLIERESMGTGTMGTTFKSSDNSLEFLLEEGNVSCTAGDHWVLRTSPYLGDIEIKGHEILLLDEDNLEITITGGRE